MNSPVDTTLHLLLGAAPPPRLLRSVLQLARAGRPVRIYLEAYRAHRIGLTPRYAERFADADGRFLLAPDFTPTGMNRVPQTCISFALGEKGKLPLETNDVYPPRQLQQLFAELGERATPVDKPQLLRLLAGEDVALPLAETSLSFTADQSETIAGQLVKLAWSAPPTARLSLEPGPGPVPAVGELRVPVRETTQFVLTARLPERMLRRSLTVRVTEAVQLTYWLTVEPTSGGGAPFRLSPRPDLPHHYGIPAGLPLMLHWRATGADGVMVNGAPAPVAGTRVLALDGLHHLAVTATAAGQPPLRYDLTLRVFSPALTTAKP